MDSKSHIRSMIDAVRQGKASDANVFFEKAMKGKLNTSLNERKMSIAAQIYPEKKG